MTDCRRALILIGLAALSIPAAGQNWNSQEQELIDHVRSCWDAWIDAQRQEGGADAFFAKCPWDENASMWWTEFGAPQDPERIRREWDFFAGVDLYWVDLRPVTVRIWGDIGMIQMYGYWKAKTPAGPVTTEAKRTELFRKDSNRWIFLGGQGTPVSASDAAPYR